MYIFYKEVMAESGFSGLGTCIVNLCNLEIMSLPTVYLLHRTPPSSALYVAEQHKALPQFYEKGNI